MSISNKILNITSIEDFSQFMDPCDKELNTITSKPQILVPRKIKFGSWNIDLPIMEKKEEKDPKSIRSQSSPKLSNIVQFSDSKFSNNEILLNFEKFGLLKEFKKNSTSKSKLKRIDKKLNLNKISNDIDTMQELNPNSFQTPKQKSKVFKNFFDNSFNQKNAKKRTQLNEDEKLKFYPKIFPIQEKKKPFFKENLIRNVKFGKKILHSQSMDLQEKMLPVIPFCSIQSIRSNESLNKDSTPLQNSTPSFDILNKWEHLSSKNIKVEFPTFSFEDFDFPFKPKYGVLEGSNKSMSTCKVKSSQMESWMQTSDNCQIMNQNQVEYKMSTFNFFADTTNEKEDDVKNVIEGCGDFFDQKKSRMNRSDGIRHK